MNMRLVNVIASLLIFLASMTNLAYAGSGGGRVVLLMAHVGDIVIFALDGPRADQPACSSDQWALSLATQTGKAQYALLLSAQAQGKVVHVQGAGLCDAWSDRERPLYIWIAE